MDSLFETFKNLGAARLGLMLMTFVGLIIFFIFIAARSGTPSMSLLYKDLSTSDSTEISAKLDLVNIPYSMGENGDEILVSRENVGRARVLLAEEGLPRGASLGYEIFDQKQSFGTTSFVQNINQLRALEGELSRTIGSLDQVRSARVQLVLPQRELFSRETKPASASVFLNLRKNAMLSSEQVMAIQHLVAASVPQLKANAVAIIDSAGALLARGDDTDDNGAIAAATSNELKYKFERRLTRDIEDMVGRIVGFGKVRVNVASELDFDVITKNLESYDPNGQVVRSTQSVSDDSTDTSGSESNAVSVASNLPGLPDTQTGAAPVGSASNHTEEVVNYEISRSVENIIHGSGEVKRLSIAVLVDGKYEEEAPATTAPAPAADAADGETAEPKMKYVPRTKEELDQITSLVKSAMGYDESRGDKIEIVNMQFADAERYQDAPKEDLVMGFEKADVMKMAETLVLSLVAVLILLLVVRPLISHIITSASAASAASAAASKAELAMLTQGGSGAPQLGGPSSGSMAGFEDQGGSVESMIDMSQVEGRVKASSVQKVSEIVTNHPTETVAVIRGWMSQES